MCVLRVWHVCCVCDMCVLRVWHVCCVCDKSKVMRPLMTNGLSHFKKQTKTKNLHFFYRAVTVLDHAPYQDWKLWNFQVFSQKQSWYSLPPWWCLYHLIWIHVAHTWCESCHTYERVSEFNPIHLVICREQPGVSQCVATCCSVLQCVAVYCSVLQ